MTTTEAPVRADWSEQTVAVLGAEIRVAKAGSGPAVLVLPRENGHAPENPCLDQLAQANTLYFPWLPGFHGSDPDSWSWLTNVRDLAVVVRQLTDALGLERYSLLGLGFGGWLAAEIATMCGRELDAMVLVAPMGVKPRDAYIYDQFIVSTEHYARLGFHDEAKFNALYGEEPEFEQLEAWEVDREMTSRLAWKPYMYNPVLPQLLAGVKARSLIVWGDDDQIVPAECGDIYADALPGAKLERIPGAGHAVDLEKPAELAHLAAPYLANR